MKVLGRVTQGPLETLLKNTQGRGDLQDHQGTDRGRVLEIETTGGIQAKRVNIENHNRVIILKSMTGRGEMNHRAGGQGMCQATGTETDPRTGKGTEGLGGVIGLPAQPAVVLEEVVEEEKGTKVQDMKKEEEEAEVIKIGERVMPAMERAEKLAQRPMVMGGLL